MSILEDKEVQEEKVTEEEKVKRINHRRQSSGVFSRLPSDLELNIKVSSTPFSGTLANKVIKEGQKEMTVKPVAFSEVTLALPSKSNSSFFGGSDVELSTLLHSFTSR